MEVVPAPETVVLVEVKNLIVELLVVKAFPDRRYLTLGR